MVQNKRRPTAKERRSRLFINILTLIVLILLVFEGKSLIRLFSAQSLQERIQEEEEEVFASANIQTTEASSHQDPASEQKEGETDTSKETDAPQETKAPETEDPAVQRANGLPGNDASYLDLVVPPQAQPVDDSYFEDAVFIGDSRMQGFRNLSGITKGSFVTAVGMELENFYTSDQIATAKGNVKVMDALQNLNYSKIYMMLGTNELGAYDIEGIEEAYSKVLADIKSCSSSADPDVYVYSVIYVEEALVTTGDYVNNTNVDAVNREILDMCRKEGYHYINLNEIFSDGSGSLIPGASEDGIHLGKTYCEQWLDYTRTHYLPRV